MDGSVRTEQALQEEVRTLRAKVAELERAAAYHQQIKVEYQHVIQREQEKEQILKAVVTRQQELEQRIAEMVMPTEQTHTLDTVFETITVGLAVYDAQGNITRINSVFRQMLGIDAEPAYLARNIEQRARSIRLRDEKGYPLAPEHWPVNRILHGEVLASDQETTLSFSTFDGRDLQVSVSGAPLHDEQNRISGAVAIYQDITARRKLEQRSQEVLRTLLAMAEILVQGTDQADSGEVPVKSSVKSSVNRVLQRLLKLARRILGSERLSATLIDAESERLQPVAIVGTSKEEARHWLEVTDGLPLNAFLNDPQQINVLSAGGSITVEHAILMPMHVGSRLVGFIAIDYGDTHHTWTREELTLAEAVSRLTVLVLERERLLLERAEAHANELALMEANRRMDEFLSIVSHELRTPLTTINGNIQLAKRRVATLIPSDDTTPELDDKIELIQDLLNRAERQVRIQNRLVSDLLDVSRIQVNRLELYIRPCNLLDSVYETFEDQKMTLPARELRLIVPEGLQKIPIVADADRIGQVITNYLTNALKYSPADRPVTLFVEVLDEVARVSVKDEGPGLPPEEHEHLWQRFYRVPGINIQSGSGIGLGLGLYICRTIIERHNGQIGVQSAPGQGSTFWFTLPIQKSGTEKTTEP